MPSLFLSIMVILKSSMKSSWVPSRAYAGNAETGNGGGEDERGWQRRFNGLQKVVACGCNLNRSMADLVRDNGFEFESRRQFFVPKMPRPHGWVTLGAARKFIELVVSP